MLPSSEDGNGPDPDLYLSLNIGAALQLAAYVMLSPGGPFPIMCAAFCMSGFGISLQNAQANGFVGGLKNAQTKFSFLHGAYGTYPSLVLIVSDLVTLHLLS